MPQADDNLIRAKLQNGDPAALELIWDGYGGLLFTFLLGLTRSRPDAEDALQSVFVKIARNRLAVGRAANLKAYLFGMARHEGLSLLRRRGREALPAADADSWLTAEPGPDPGRAEAVAAALGQLPEEQRTVIVLNAFTGHTFREIAGLLDISINTAASRYRYGLAKLRDYLRKEPL